MAGTNIQDNYKTGILSMVIASICFALIAVMVKKINHLPLMEIILFSYIPTMIIIPVMIKKINISLFGNNKPILCFSGLVTVISMLASFYTFKVMSLTDAMTIRNLSPFFTFFLAGIFLKKKLHFRQIPFLLFAFLGGLLVIKPGLRLDIFPAIIALIAAISIAVIHATLRHLKLTDHYLVIINYRIYINSTANLIILLLQKSFKIPSPSDLLILTFLGVAALAAQVNITKAYQLAPASLVSLYAYSQIIFASIFGLIFFKETPNIFSIIGAGFIIVSGYLNYKYRSNNYI